MVKDSAMSVLDLILCPTLNFVVQETNTNPDFKILMQRELNCSYLKSNSFVDYHCAPDNSWSSLGFLPSCLQTFGTNFFPSIYFSSIQQWIALSVSLWCFWGLVWLHPWRIATAGESLCDGHLWPYAHLHQTPIVKSVHLSVSFTLKAGSFKQFWKLREKAEKHRLYSHPQRSCQLVIVKI